MAELKNADILEEINPERRGLFAWLRDKVKEVFSSVGKVVGDIGSSIVSRIVLGKEYGSLIREAAEKEFSNSIENNQMQNRKYVSQLYSDKLENNSKSLAVSFEDRLNTLAQNKKGDTVLYKVSADEQGNYTITASSQSMAPVTIEMDTIGNVTTKRNDFSLGVADQYCKMCNERGIITDFMNHKIEFEVLDRVEGMKERLEMGDIGDADSAPTSTFKMFGRGFNIEKAEGESEVRVNLLRDTVVDDELYQVKTFDVNDVEDIKNFVEAEILNDINSFRDERTKAPDVLIIDDNVNTPDAYEHKILEAISTDHLSKDVLVTRSPRIDNPASGVFTLACQGSNEKSKDILVNYDAFDVSSAKNFMSAANSAWVDSVFDGQQKAEIERATFKLFNHSITISKTPDGKAGVIVSNETNTLSNEVFSVEDVNEVKSFTERAINSIAEEKVEEITKSEIDIPLTLSDEEVTYDESDSVLSGDDINVDSHNIENPFFMLDDDAEKSEKDSDPVER